jgi:hypothetical protein
MLPAVSLEAEELPAGNIVDALYHKLQTQSSARKGGWNNRPKHVELIGIINKPLTSHLVGCLYYLYQWCTVKQISKVSLAIYTFTNTDRLFYSRFCESQYAQKFHLSFQPSVLALLAILYNVQALVILPPACLHTNVHIENSNQNFPSFRWRIRFRIH